MLPCDWYAGSSDAIGKVFSVIGVTYDGLILEGFPSPHPTKAWNKRSFRKIRPDKLEACEEEFVTLLKRKPVSV
jgi:hypothetical protein